MENGIFILKSIKQISNKVKDALSFDEVELGGSYPEVVEDIVIFGPTFELVFGSMYFKVVGGLPPVSDNITKKSKIKVCIIYFFKN